LQIPHPSIQRTTNQINGLRIVQGGLLNLVLDGMEGKLTNAKWAAMAKCSPDTALRDINDLLARGVLARLEGGGRNTAYILVK
jgi:Fic family protein